MSAADTAPATDAELLAALDAYDEARAAMVEHDEARAAHVATYKVAYDRVMAARGRVVAALHSRGLEGFSL